MAIVWPSLTSVYLHILVRLFKYPRSLILLYISRYFYPDLHTWVLEIRVKLLFALTEIYMKERL